MDILVVTMTAILFMLVIFITIKVIKSNLSQREYSFDSSTTLLMKQRNIRRKSISKAEKVACLAEVELEIEHHLENIEIHIANDIATAKYQTL